jgi:hypothetical protein
VSWCYIVAMLIVHDLESKHSTCHHFNVRDGPLFDILNDLLRKPYRVGTDPIVISRMYLCQYN